MRVTQFERLIIFTHLMPLASNFSTSSIGIDFEICSLFSGDTLITKSLQTQLEYCAPCVFSRTSFIHPAYLSAYSSLFGVLTHFLNATVPVSQHHDACGFYQHPSYQLSQLSHSGRCTDFRKKT